MQRALLILSIGTLLVLGAAVAGQALVVMLGVTYTPSGQPADLTPLPVIVSFLAGLGGILSVPLCLATFVLGLVAMLAREQYGWVVAVVVAGVLGLVGVVGMAWVLLSANSPVAFVTPLALIPLVTVLYSLRPDPGTARRPGAS